VHLAGQPALAEAFVRCASTPYVYPT